MRSKDIRDLPQVKPAILQERLGKGKARCLTCERRCILGDGEYGFCRTRINIEGQIYTMTYGLLSAVESRPIEIKPFFHFWPGSTALTFSTWSCNFRCPWCQNWGISRILPEPWKGTYTEPEEVVRKALENRDEGVCVSFNEPTLLFEYSLDVFKIARKKGLYSTYVSNGYMTLDALKMLKEAGLNGLKVDIKGSKKEYLKINAADVDVVWRNCRKAKELGIHVELVYLVVTGATDNEESIVETIEKTLKELGDGVPIHFTRYFPAYKYREPPTPIEKLEWAYKTARRMGVKYPYIGNVPGHPYENTYCPECGEVLVKRYGAMVIKYRLTADKKCPKCGEHIPIAGRPGRHI